MTVANKIRMEQVAAYVSLFGVVLIARPLSLFSSMSASSESASSITATAEATNAAQPSSATNYDNVTPAERALAVGVAMLGVLGAAGAYTTIRWIGKRAHPLISVNYFATWCTIVSTVMMFALPGVGFLLPANLKDWCYLIFLGICGFVMVRLSILVMASNDQDRYLTSSQYSNSCSQQACSRRSPRAQQTWSTHKCFSP